jgi:hypothetical protein
VGLGQPAGGPTALELFFLFYENFICREKYPTLGTRVTRGSDVALGKELFAGLAVSRASCREFPLSTACAERNWAFAESNALSAKPSNLVVLQITKRAFLCKVHLFFTKCNPYKKRLLYFYLLISYCSLMTAISILLTDD